VACREKSKLTIYLEFLWPYWQNLEVPEDWKKGVIIKLPKKGSLKDCNNWREITLLSTPGKVSSRVLLNRLQDAVDYTLRDEQAGFRKGRSCTEQIFTQRNIIEQSLEHQQDLTLTSSIIKKHLTVYTGHPCGKFWQTTAFLTGSLMSSRHCMTTPAAVSRLQVGTQSSFRFSQGFDKAVYFHHSSPLLSSTSSCAELWTSRNTASSGRSGTA